MSINSEDICLWADETWCFGEELEEMGWMSDDFQVIKVDTPEHSQFLAKIEGDLAKEHSRIIQHHAQIMVDEGYHPDQMCHVIWYPDGTCGGLATPLPLNADMSGYTERYRPLGDWLQRAAA